VTDQPPLLGRKPRWQQRWEARSQRRFEEQARRVDAQTLRRARLDQRLRGADGREYVVRGVRRGESLRLLDGGSDSLVGLLITLVGWLISLTLKGWRVGVVRTGGRL